MSMKGWQRKQPIQWLSSSLLLFCVLISLQISLFLRPLSDEYPSLISSDDWTLVPSRVKGGVRKRITNWTHLLPPPPPVHLVRCQHDGTCPYRTTCLPNKHYYPGTCRRWTNIINSSKAKCIDHCRSELELDEIFYHASRPQILDSFSANEGCGLVFRRQQGIIVSGNRTQWMETRDRFLVRVDPESDDAAHSRNRTWRAYCRPPCTEDSDCNEGLISNQPSNSTVPFQCIQYVCRRNPMYWEANGTTDLTIVTGTTEKYFEACLNFLASLRYWAPNLDAVVFNLGDLSVEQIQVLQNQANVKAVHWREGIPAHYPGHLGKPMIYAWKPVAIYEALVKYRQIFWFDAGGAFTGYLDPLQNILKRQGIFLVQGQDNAIKGDPGTFKWLHVKKDEGHFGPSFAGGVQGHFYPSRYFDSVVRPNAECALELDCIRPQGASIRNHRFDQTSLSILAHLEEIPPHTEYLDSTQSFRLDEPHEKFLVTFRGSNRYYSKRERRRAQSELLRATNVTIQRKKQPVIPKAHMEELRKLLQNHST